MEIEAEYVPVVVACPNAAALGRYGVSWSGAREGQGIMPRFAESACTWVARILAVAGVGLMLGACTKCDVPTWPSSQPGAPASCHGDAPTR
jgi:hypothetical protein